MNIIDIYLKELIALVVIIFIINYKLGLIILFFFILFFILNKFRKENDNKDNKNKGNKCRIPTMNNPYGNYLIGEDHNLESCNLTDNNKISDNYNSFNVYENAHDINIGSTNKMYRDFYTTTITNNPNNVNDFINKTYINKNLSCKIDNNCLVNENIRF